VACYLGSIGIITSTDPWRSNTTPRGHNHDFLGPANGKWQMALSLGSALAPHPPGLYAGGLELCGLQKQGFRQLRA
jgi:hypothetical protein